MSPAAPLRRRMRRDDRARQLLEVAESVFAERGIAATTMDEVAERAGVTKPVLYDHFGSKDGLLAALVRNAGADLQGVITRAISGASGPARALESGLESYFAFMQEHGEAWNALVSEAPPAGEAGRAIEQVRGEQVRFISELMRLEMPQLSAPRAAVYAEVVVGAAERLASVAHAPAPSQTARLSSNPQLLAAALMDVIWIGFEGLRRGRRWTAAPD